MAHVLSSMILLLDEARVKSIHAKLAKINPGSTNVKQTDSTTLPVKDGIVIGSSSYIVTIGLGTPKKDLSVVFDTGSDITWTQSQPCGGYCYEQMDPIFSPFESSTYSNITCDNPVCLLLAIETDKSFSTGFYAVDKLTLTSTDEFYILFGCGQENQVSVFTTSGAVIDSGTIITRLPATAYDALRSEFQKQMSQHPMAERRQILDTCYDLSEYSTISVPTISFFFNGDVEVPIHEQGIIIGGSPSQKCLAFVGNSDDAGVAIFGNTQQKTLEVVYDGAGERIGFTTRGCT
ncbi:hypothetical protein DITRI_Ditri10aG0140300 [Diplodiscus trichospermus]